MALKRWRWVWAPVLAAGILAVLLLPGGQLSQAGLMFWFLPQQLEYYPRWSFRSDVQTALRVQRERLVLAQRADSIVAAARGPRALRAWGAAVTVVYETPILADTARLWLQAALAELARYPGGASSGGRMVVALYSNPARAHSRDYANTNWSTRRLLPDPLGAACIVEVNLVPRESRQGMMRRPPQRPAGPFLGWCGLFQRFGSPGPAIARWIGLGRWRGNGSVDAGWSSLVADAGRPIPRREIYRPDLSESYQWAWYWGTPWVQLACLRGTRSLCERNAKISGSQDYWWFFEFRGSELVAFLLAGGTPAQFAAFWRSPLGVADALRQAYGRTAGQLAYEAFSHWHYASPGGPRAEPRLLLAGLFWAGAALALALVAGRRWKTEI